jgi:5-methyltetrahydropteroyltriglutamate--homocysteine methyltransferase
VKRSRDRILTTHTGSLPRPPDLVSLLTDQDNWRASTLSTDGRARVREAVQDAVHKQVAAGIDVVSDGEMGKPGFVQYITDRLTGFQGKVPSRRFEPQDLQDYPDVAKRLFTTVEGVEQPRPRMPANDGPITYVGQAQLQTDLENFAAAMDREQPTGAFLPAISPGCVAMLLGTVYFPSRHEYVFALADALRVEYKAIVDAGFVLQVDCPDLALGRHEEFAGKPLSEFRENIALHIEALNHALEGIDPENVRVHVCWGNYPGPHHHDVPLADILDILYRINANGLSIEGANPRHQHEWNVFEEFPLPADKVLIPGVIDTCTNYIEHPEVVAQRIAHYAQVVGRERVIAGTDCGFGTMAGRSAVVPAIAYAKLASLAEGAKLASEALW